METALKRGTLGPPPAVLPDTFRSAPSEALQTRADLPLVFLMPHSLPISRRSWLVQCAIAGGGSLASLTGVVGCGGSTPPAGSSPRPSLKYRLGLIGRHRDSIAFRAAANAAQQRATELSASLPIPVELSVLAPDRENPAAQVEWIEQLVREEAAGIAVEVSEAESLRQAVIDASARGVPVLCFNTDLPDSSRFVFLGLDEVQAGQTLMRRCVALLRERRPDAGGFQIAILGGSRESSLLQRRIDAAQVEAVRHDEVRLAGTFLHTGTPGDALKTLVAAHREAGPIDGWVLLGDWPLDLGASGGDAGADATAGNPGGANGDGSSADRFPWQPGEVVCVAMDALPAQLARLKAGEVQMLLARPYRQLGVRIAELLIERASQGTQPAGERESLPCEEVLASQVEELEKKWQTWLTPTVGGPA